MGARISSGSDSFQAYATPEDFMEKVRRKFGSPAYDLAAFSANAKAPEFFTEKEDSLKRDWHKLSGILWLNPPFKNIEVWARKCAIESNNGARILFLVPVSVSDWFVNWVVPFADVYFLHGRLCFDGKAPYPKDCMLCDFQKKKTHKAKIWNWRTEDIIDW